MHITETADLMPGACYVTGRNDGPFIDTGYDIDDLPNVGRVYLAASFISDATQLLGGLGAQDAQRLRDGIAQRDVRIIELEEAIVGLTTANEALVKAGYSPTKFAPLEMPMFEDASDDDLLELAIDLKIEVPSNATRDDLIAALTDQATA